MISLNRISKLRGAPVLVSFAFFTAVTVFGPCRVDAGTADTGDHIRFKWAFAALHSGGDPQKLEAITQDRSLKSGDRVKVLVELEQKCFVYVIHHGPKGSIDLLFPYNLEQFSSDYQVNRSYPVPRGGAWLQLDEQPGNETFYLLASDHRLIGLEDLLQQYEVADEKKRADLSDLILSEIRDLRRRNQELTAPAERPATIGGAIRGIQSPAGSQGTDLDSLSQEIASSSFYAKAFTIDHK